MYKFFFLGLNHHAYFRAMSIHCWNCQRLGNPRTLRRIIEEKRSQCCILSHWQLMIQFEWYISHFHFHYLAAVLVYLIIGHVTCLGGSIDVEFYVEKKVEQKEKSKVEIWNVLKVVWWISIEMILALTKTDKLLVLFTHVISNYHECLTSLISILIFCWKRKKILIKRLHCFHMHLDLIVLAGGLIFWTVFFFLLDSKCAVIILLILSLKNCHTSK